MPDRPIRPEGAPWVTPYLIVRDVAASLAFYEKAFGFTKKTGLPDEKGELQFAEIFHKDHMMMLGKEDAYGNPAKSPATTSNISPMSLYLYCDNVDQFYENAIANGAQCIDVPTNMFWGDRICRLRGPDGYVWSFATHVADFDPSKMQNST